MSYDKNRLSYSGLYIILLYYLVYYFVPLTLQFYYSENISNLIHNGLPRSIYKNNIDYYYNFIYLMISVLLFLFLYFFCRPKKLNSLRANFSSKLLSLYLYTRKYLITCSLFLSLYINYSVLGQLRGAVTLNELGIIALITVVIKTILILDIILIFALKDTIIGSKFNNIYLNFFTLISHTLLNDGNVDSFIGVILFGYLLLPKLSLLMTYKFKNIFFTFFQYFIVYISLIPFLVVMLYLGESIKQGYALNLSFRSLIDFFYSNYTNLNILFLYLTEVFSRDLYSFAYAISDEFRLPFYYFGNEYYNTLSIVLSGFLYRISVILNLIIGSADVVKPEITTFSGMNLFLLTDDESLTRQGTAPGVLASFIYVFGKFFGIISGTIYLCFIAIVYDALLSAAMYSKGKNLLFMLIILILSLFLFQSPIDFFLIIGNYPLLMFVTIIFSFGVKNLLSIEINRNK